MTQQNEAVRLAEYLERGGDFPPTLADAAAELRRLAKVEAQRDQLLEALKKLDNFFETYRPEGHPASDPHELVRVAIKAVEVEGEKACPGI